MYSRLSLGIATILCIVMGIAGLLLPLGTDPIWYRLVGVAAILVGAGGFAWLYRGVGNADSRAGRQIARDQARLDALPAASLYRWTAYRVAAALFFGVASVADARDHGLLISYGYALPTLAFVLYAAGCAVETRRAVARPPAQTRNRVRAWAGVAVLALAAVGFGVWRFSWGSRGLAGPDMNRYPFSVTFSRDGRELLSGGFDATKGGYSSTYGLIRRWDVATGKLIGQPLQGYTSGVYAVALSPDGQTLAALESSNGVRLWDVGSGRSISLFGGYGYDVTRMAFSPDGKTVATANDKDGTITLWDGARGWPRNWPFDQPLHGGEAKVAALAFSPDGQRLASGSADGTVRLWEAATGQLLGQPIAAHSSVVSSLAFSPDGRRLASGGYDRAIRLWDAATGKAVTQPAFSASASNGLGLVTSLAFSPDGKLLASGAPVELWDAASGQPIIGQPLNATAGVIHALAFSPDGQWLAVAGDDHVIHLWDVTQNPPVERVVQ